MANVFQKQVLGVPESPGGLFAERPGTDFGRPAGRRVTREESRAVVRRLYDGVISTGRAEDAGMIAEDYIQNSGWTPGARGLLLAARAAWGGWSAPLPPGLSVPLQEAAAPMTGAPGGRAPRS